MAQHSTLTDPNLHEPKGVAAAAAGQVYVANGSGSGNWVRIQGWEQYADTDQTVGTPTQNISTGVRTLFLCDGGTTNLTTYTPSDRVNPLWDTTNNKHVPIAEFDTYDLRIVFTAENYAGTSPYLTMELDIGGSIGTIVQQTIPLLRSGAAQQVLWSFPVYTGATYFANGGEVYLTYNGTGTCDIYGNGIMINRTSRAT